MAYQALYRKWRPRTFDSVIGQEAITDTLKNAIKRGKVSHAFLFAGPRGTGKTSCAKIFAKALNCTNLQDGEPCNECANCKAADEGAMPDIMEIDAASNNGVDEIREIRDKVKYAPTEGKYKVYIIDEVHMLSMGAFNALLKTLEEPPEHVVFILATTELQKVPATIISRTQRYNFKRISKADLEKRMKYILDQENIKYEDKALAVIAQVADGGMRDALSILDQLLSYEKESVNYQDALEITGFAARENIEQILLALLDQDAGNALKLVQAELDQGASSKNILDELIDLATKALLLIKVGDSGQETFLTEDFAEQIKQVSNDRFYQLIALANTALNDLRYTNQQQIPLEVFVVEASQAEKVLNKEQVEVSTPAINPELANKVNILQTQVASLKKQLDQLSKAKPLATDQVFQLDTAVPKINKPAPKIDKPEPAVKKARTVKRPAKSTAEERQAIYHVLANATKQDLNTVRSVWPDLQSVLEDETKAIINVLEPVAASADQVVMKCQYDFWIEKARESDLLDQVSELIARFAKQTYKIVLVPDKEWATVRQEFLAGHRDEILAKQRQKDEAAADENSEVIDKAKELFGDAVTIKD